MSMIPMTEATLRQAMRDRRYWQPGHPDREDYAGWVTAGWRALGTSPHRSADGTAVVFVKAYDRERDRHVQHVAAHQRSAPPRTDRPPAPAGPGQGTAEDPPLNPSPQPTRLSPSGASFMHQWEYQAGRSDRPHWGGGNSGVTLGPGYDMSGRTREGVQADLLRIGLPRDLAMTLAAGAGRRGSDAREFAAEHRDAVRLTETQQRALMGIGVEEAQSVVRQVVTVPLNQNQFDALTSLTYNIGQGNFRRSTLLRRLNTGDYTGAAEQFGAWTGPDSAVFRGLAARRAAERRLFEHPFGTEGAVP